MHKKSEKDQTVYSKKSIIILVSAYLFGFSGGLFLYPFIGYQGLIAFGVLGMGILLLAVSLSQHR
jgi:hypothetical protein